MDSHIKNLVEQGDIDGLVNQLRFYSTGRGREAADALVSMGDKGLNAIIPKLEDPNPAFHNAIPQVFRTIKDDRIVKPLIQSLEIERSAIKFIVLGELGDETIVPDLIKQIPNCKNGRELLPLARAMLNFSATVAIDPLIEAMNTTLVKRRDLQDATGLAEIIKQIDETSSKKLLRVFITDYIKMRNGMNPNHKISAGWISNQFNYLKHVFSIKEIGECLEELYYFEDAIKLYNFNEMIDEATKAKKKEIDLSAAKIAQKLVQGDEITTIQDSVISRSTIGSGGGSGDLMADLTKLGEMKREGLLTEEEFTAAKAKLLNR